MKNLKDSFMSTCVVIAILVFASAPQQVWAQNSANGSAIENTYGKTGNATTGGDNTTGGTGTYGTGLSNQDVSGFATITGAGVSNAVQKGTDAVSKSNSTFSYDLGTTGPVATNTINGFAGQDNFATAQSPKSGDYADGGNGTVGTLIGSNTGGADSNTIASSGNAIAKGNTVADITVAPNGLSAKSTAKTNGMSNASGLMIGGVPQLATGVIGTGGNEGGVLVSGPNKSGAEGNFTGNFTYGATNMSGSTTGAGYANGQSATNVSKSGNAATAATTVSSGAQTQTKP